MTVQHWCARWWSGLYMAWFGRSQLDGPVPGCQLYLLFSHAVCCRRFFLVQTCMLFPCSLQMLSSPPCEAWCGITPSSLLALLPCLKLLQNLIEGLRQIYNSFRIWLECFVQECYLALKLFSFSTAWWHWWSHLWMISHRLLYQGQYWEG